MMPLKVRTTRLLLALAMTAAGCVLAGSAATAAPVSIELCATTGTTSLPGPVSVSIWGFGVPTTPGLCGTATAGLPGPVLSVNEGDVVTLTVRNNLPAGHAISFEAPGIDFAPGPSEAAPGSAVTLTFTAANPGTYLYQSGGDAGRQEAMGLYGALIVRSATANQAYEVASTAYDDEAVLVLSAIDPAFNAAPATFDMLDYNATFWLINGKAYPDVPNIASAAGRRVLLRYVNAGFDNSTMLLVGTHERVFARDAHLLPNSFLAAAETIPAGGTEDAIATVPSSAPPSTHGFPLFNRQLHVTNGDQTAPDPTPAGAGGMLTFIQP